jgi:hypothetical protein
MRGLAAGVVVVALAGGAAAQPLTQPAQPTQPTDKVAWTLVASSLALVTVGGVLAYAADSAENDVSDLYVGLAGRPPQYDAKTAETYRALVEQGRRYERLSWLSFGLAGGAALSAAVLFYLHRDGAREPSVVIAPAATPGGAGVGASLRF